MSVLEEVLYSHILVAGIPVPERQEKIIPNRKFQFDFSWPLYKIVVEVDGGEWIQGRHSRGKGMASDNEKMNEVQLLGWKIFRFTGKQVTSGYALSFLQRYFSSAVK